MYINNEYFGPRGKGEEKRGDFRTRNFIIFTMHLSLSVETNMGGDRTRIDYRMIPFKMLIGKSFASRKE